MGRENWKTGENMPPRYVDVVKREQKENGEVVVFIKGHHVHYGQRIQGFTGPETVVRFDQATGKIIPSTGKF